MKITEIKNKLFGLSDLNGLIKESVFDEARPKAGGPTMRDFFKLHPEFIDKTYYNSPELRAALYDYFRPTEEFPNITAFPHPDEYEGLPPAQRKLLYTRVNNGKPDYLDKMQKGNRALQFADDNLVAQNAGVDRPVTLQAKKMPIDILRLFFQTNGGKLVFDESILSDFQAIKNYVDSASLLADDANTYFVNNNIPLRAFNDAGCTVGDITDPFSFFLLFYYIKYCEKRGRREKTDIYLGNIQDQNVKQYVMYVFKMAPNIYATIESNINNARNGWGAILSQDGFDSDELLISRSGAYFDAYQKKYGNILNEPLIAKMSQCFSLPKTMLFDPVSNNITDSMIGDGIRKWANGKNEYALQELIKPQIVIDANDGCPAEKIFYTARALDGLLTASYKKYGKIAETSKMTIDFLLMDGMEAINMWNRNKNKEDIPASLTPLKTIYDGKKKTIATGEILTEEVVPFWRLLNFKNEFKDKTQGEIYYFLINNSDNTVEWQYEYNRKKKGDPDLHGQSIDILGRTSTNTYCFEYQGEQHYRPITVTYDDYAAFPLFTEMREYILTECGFIQKTVGGTKFYSGPENADADRMREIRGIIIRAYEMFARRLSSKISDTNALAGKIKSKQLAEAFVIAPVNKWKTQNGEKVRVKFDTDYEMLAYFQNVMRHTADDEEIFEAPAVGGVIPYLGSPRRFLDEVKTAQDMGRDITKRNAIKNAKEKANWVLSYIIPGLATEDEKRYTTELAGSENLVFTWNKDGRNKLIGFLHANNLATEDPNNNTPNDEDKSLFEQIIKEVLTDYDS